MQSLAPILYADSAAPALDNKALDNKASAIPVGAHFILEAVVGRLAVCLWHA